jgi:predicted ThiF/HesA family dinucleotide-utilizing enzyme
MMLGQSQGNVISIGRKAKNRGVAVMTGKRVEVYDLLGRRVSVEKGENRSFLKRLGARLFVTREESPGKN